MKRRFHKSRKTIKQQEDYPEEKLAHIKEEIKIKIPREEVSSGS
jgi:hypothetical protein